MSGKLTHRFQLHPTHQHSLRRLWWHLKDLLHVAPLEDGSDAAI